MDHTNIELYSGKDADRRMRYESDTVLRRFVVGFANIRDRIAKALDGGEGERQRCVDLARKDLQEGRVTMATVDRRVAAFAHWEPLERKLNGRTVYEVAGVWTDEPFRGRGLSSLVSDRCIQEVLARDPRALFLVFTSHPHLIARYEKWAAEGRAQCRDIGVEGWAHLWERPEDVTQESMDELQKHYPDKKAYILDFSN